MEADCVRLGKAQCCFLVLNCKWKLTMGGCGEAKKVFGLGRQYVNLKIIHFLKNSSRRELEVKKNWRLMPQLKNIKQERFIQGSILGVSYSHTMLYLPNQTFCFPNKEWVQHLILHVFVLCFLGQQNNNGYIITEGGLLKCKNIIHVIGGNDVKKSVSCVLQECERRNYSSVCLPAIGTGW